ncbi:MAG: histidinol-phosphatase HisJ family protein [Gemmiger sp.]
MYGDYHLHTEYSADSMYDMEQEVQDAIAAGLEEICFTDHVDYGVKQDWTEPSVRYDPSQKSGQLLRNVQYPAYFARIAQLQQEYAGQIVIRAGLEFGMQVETVEQYESLFSSWPLDFVILSCHQVENKTFWNQQFQQGKSQDEYQQRYYGELLSLVRRYKKYSVLGHLDMIARYDPAGPYPFEKIRDIVTEILREVIRDGKGIEINTSCYRYGLQDLTPSRQILRLYRQLGGTILTIGSDTHKREQHIAAHVDEAMRELRSMGFESVCTFSRMEPQFHPL